MTSTLHVILTHLVGTQKKKNEVEYDKKLVGGEIADAN
jgi:hypothetical protein